MGRPRLVIGLLMSIYVLFSSAAGTSMAGMGRGHCKGCGMIQEYMFVCSGFLTGFHPFPPANCCYNVQTLNDLVHMGLSSKEICYCIEDLVKRLACPFINSRVNDLPVKCKTWLSFPISNAMDCSRVV